MSAIVSGKKFYMFNDSVCGECQRFEECYRKSLEILKAESPDDKEQSKLCPACEDFEGKDGK